jgi:choline kinase
VDHTRGVTIHRSSSSSQLQEFQDHEKSAEHEKQIEEEVDRLLEEATLWRAATSVLWVAWAIVQADLDKELKKPPMCEDDDLESTLGYNYRKHRKGTMDLSSKAYSEPQGPASETNGSSTRAGEGKRNGSPTEKMLHGEHSGRKEDVFDYLGCAQDRVLVFWGDVVNLRIISAAELPERVRKRMKICDDKRREPDGERIVKGGDVL